MKMIERKYWKDHALEFGYELGEADKYYYVKFLWPSYLQAGKKEGNELKLYKKLSTAETKILNFKKEHGFYN